ncbi:TPA: hypothetical protein L9L17_005443 [Klebsiella pneumoniae]|nr:hypothetical protein [Klebsiella pneumoniae]HBR1148653.1 hypothetical protein [Klebsiella pneumoniae]HBR1186481.1 hypothetical protein [Klebsiella pneumoniae]HBR1330116.1 hypothetical protein [Klebsiella pneumoniae]HBR1335503.1 hypothetical protein [Klebsiella pneumoniae]
MTDITELAQSKSLRKKLNRRLNDAYGFQRTSGGKHTTISLSIDECKSIIAAMDERLALVEALEKAQQRIAQLESRTVTVSNSDIFNVPGGDTYVGGEMISVDTLLLYLAEHGIKVEAE